MDAREIRRARTEDRQRRADERRARGRDAPWRRRWRMARRRAGNAALDLLGPLALRALARTWRIETVGADGFAALEQGGAYVAAMWHGRMLIPCPLHRDRGVAVLVSPSDDGKLVTEVLARYGYRVLRGSASRRGSRALREMAETLRAGTPVVITPDGPRGPRHAMNVGVAWLARATDAPILPVALACDRAWRLRSWDRFTIPRPFARIVVHYGEAVRVPTDTDDLALERISAAVRERMMADERAAFARLGTADDLGT